jgi:hypothetical protein
VLTVHHWRDLERGFAEMRRVARRIVVLTWDPDLARSFWLSREYLPDEAVEWDIARCPPLETVTRLVGDAVVTPVPVPRLRWSCSDYFKAFAGSNTRRRTETDQFAVARGRARYVLVRAALWRSVVIVLQRSAECWTVVSRVVGLGIA